MTFTIEAGWPGVRVELTTDSTASSYGIPVPRIKADGESGDYGPADALPAGPWAAGDDLSPCCGAELVLAWARQPGRTAEEIQAARRFLRQWADGPQIE